MGLHVLLLLVAFFGSSCCQILHHPEEDQPCHIFVGVWSQPTSDGSVHRQWIRKTWWDEFSQFSGHSTRAKKQVCLQFFIRKPGNEQEMLEVRKERAGYDDMFIEDYDSLEATWFFFHHVYTHYNSKFIVKMDDDSFVHAANLRGTLEQLRVDAGLYFGFGCGFHQVGFKARCNLGFVLSRDIIQELEKYSETNQLSFTRDLLSIHEEKTEGERVSRWIRFLEEEKKYRMHVVFDRYRNFLKTRETKATASAAATTSTAAAQKRRRS